MAKKTAAKKSPAAVPVDHHAHPSADRVNIPTSETAGFVRSQVEQAVHTRDKALDPQLVWTGKAEQDGKPFVVPVVPIHVHEKVHPRAIIEDLRARKAEGRPPAADLFSDFNGLDDFSQKLDFYNHSQHWTNRLILGDSLLAMTSLAEKERLRGRVQCVYFDPPYGIKFGSNWQVSTRKRDVKDARAEDLTRQPEQVKAFRDTWELGIHSYLTYLRDRLTAARDLLTDSGSCFVQIGDENVHLVRCLMDEVFGAENFISLICCAKTTGTTGEYLAGTIDYVIWYAKLRLSVKYNQLYSDKKLGGAGATGYSQIELADGSRRSLQNNEKSSVALHPLGSKIYSLDNLTSPRVRDARTGYYGIEIGGRSILPQKGEWKTNREGMKRLQIANRVQLVGNTPRYVRMLHDFASFPINNIWNDTVVAGFASEKVYIVETSTKIVQRCLLMATDPGDLVLDPTCGSGTTAYVAEQWGRRWIAIDTSRVAVALARTRLMAAKFPYYLLADSAAGRKKLADLGRADTAPPPSPLAGPADVARGFVYKTVPHVTLKSIANNPDIREGMTRAEIDAAIAKHAETETLYDQPYEDKGTVRVCGPFTVEGLSPHRELPPVEGITPATDAPTKLDPGNYLRTIVDNLREAGVKGSDKRERIGFERLDPFPGRYVVAEGSTDKGLAVRVSVGPELGTVGDEWVKAAALEAIKGSAADLLLVCGFAFDATVHGATAELTKEMQFGKLTVLPIRINPDLAMFGDANGQELLKKTGSANLFTVFGEPDLDVTRGDDGRYTVTINGLDVFDPATGEVRESGTADIACWFLDTAYDGQSFFVRQAYFCGATDPYEKLKKALRAEIDEAEWSKLTGTTSRPFAAPAGRSVAVKVISHFGDEVLKVMTLPGA
jgi:adenine-specific DNA-methyltransferase